MPNISAWSRHGQDLFYELRGAPDPRVYCEYATRQELELSCGAKAVAWALGLNPIPPKDKGVRAAAVSLAKAIKEL